MVIVSALGRFIRKVRNDNLPQLINVLIGSMSIVGPRPERPDFVKQLPETVPYYAERHCLRPGLSGWAQLRYNYGSSEEDAIEKLQFDLYYLKNNNFLLDLVITCLKPPRSHSGARAHASLFRNMSQGLFLCPPQLLPPSFTRRPAWARLTNVQ